jgi:hypothetical protein
MADDVRGEDDVIDDAGAVSTEQTPARQILPLPHSVPRVKKVVK